MCEGVEAVRYRGFTAASGLRASAACGQLPAASERAGRFDRARLQVSRCCGAAATGYATAGAAGERGCMGGIDEFIWVREAAAEGPLLRLSTRRRVNATRRWCGEARRGRPTCMQTDRVVSYRMLAGQMQL